MREILFRGKRLDNGEWKYGSYSYQYGCHEILLETCEGEYGFDHYEVDSSTICQYTGLNDKNGKRIFEGDIVRFKWDVERNYFFFIEFSDGEFCAMPMCSSDDVWPFRISGENEKLEVIGNVHDTELLRGGEDA